MIIVQTISIRQSCKRCNAIPLLIGHRQQQRQLHCQESKSDERFSGNNYTKAVISSASVPKRIFNNSSSSIRTFRTNRHVIDVLQPFLPYQRISSFDTKTTKSIFKPSNVGERLTNRRSSSVGASTGGFWDKDAISDLFDQYAQQRCLLNDEETTSKTLDMNDLQNLLLGIGKNPDQRTLQQLFQVADLDSNGVIDHEEFMENSAAFLSDTPARIILVIGGPGSGKGVLSKRLQEECNVVHISSGELLRQEVAQKSALGIVVKDIMSRGELVSSAVMVALMQKHMKDHPGKRVLLDGFPRSEQNAKDLMMLCGKPELALHLVCDDTVLMERIMRRGIQTSSRENSSNPDDEKNTKRREDDNFYAALKRLRNFHEYHNVMIEWLRNQHVPIVNLDCEGSAESVWQQLVAIGRLMRPAVKKSNILLADLVKSDRRTTNPSNNNDKGTATQQ